MKKITTSVLVICILLSACVSKEKKDRTINISGAFALYPMVVKWSEEYAKENPEVRFNISAGGAGKGMTDALSGTVDLGMFSREISQAELNQGVWFIGLCKDAVLPTISAENPLLDTLKKRGLSPEELKAIFIDGTITDWNQIIKGAESSPITIFTRSDACGAAGTWAQYLGGKQEDLLGNGINGDPTLADAVGKDPLGIGYNNTAYVYDIKTGEKYEGLEVIPIDLNSNGAIDEEEYFYDNFVEVLIAIHDGVYPSPPARELYFVAKGKPEKEGVIDFLKWVLTDGQNFVEEAGYVPITQDKLNASLKKLEE
ncbi:MAG: phosphate ABC transporter substrate-binding protein [Marinilabiliales bacterium]|nr:MAG: phosphate ABC transporter substrate-binding protein [Marinilabiliales bacterium]